MAVSIDAATAKIAYRTTPRADAVKLSLEVGAFGSCRRPGALHEGPGRALANAGRSALTCTFVAARADARPGDQVTAGGKAAHVNADLGKDCLRTPGTALTCSMA